MLKANFKGKEQNPGPYLQFKNSKLRGLARHPLHNQAADVRSIGSQRVA